jgi:hypothetical protein
MALKGVESTGNLPTIGTTTVPVSTIIIKKGANILKGFMDTVDNAITSDADADADTVLYASSESSLSYTSTGNTSVTTLLLVRLI